MLRPAAVLAAWLAAWLACTGAWAAPRDWRAVPGTEDLELDVRSVEQQASTVTAWVRSRAVPGALDRFLREAPPGLPKQRQAVVLAQADCRARQLRPLALLAYAAGVPVWSTSIPGRGIAPAAGEPLAWLYDALCEMGRGAAAGS